MNLSRIILLSIFFVTVIPTIYVYLEHAELEKQAYYNEINEGNEYAANKPLGEFLLFAAIGIGYIILAILIIVFPKKKIPYLVLLVGTVAVVIVYYFRIYGIPVPFVDMVITDLTTDWRDVVTKICQQILVIPIAILYREMFPKKTEVN